MPTAAATRHVVMLFDERIELPGLAALEAEFVRTLASNAPDPVEIYREAMDLSRFGSDTHRTALKDYLRTKYANRHGNGTFNLKTIIEAHGGSLTASPKISHGMEFQIVLPHCR